ncbi:epoxide hydrolase [Moniliophthora roreri]|nr:epoxide hydrolase [Moniliophthora roreri]
MWRMILALGSFITARIVQYQPDRVIAFAVLAVGYFPPWPDFDWDAINKATKESVGYEIYGYWGFFSSEGADKIIEDNFEKFFNILFPENAKQWIEDFVPLGKLKTYLTSKPAAPPPSWIPAEERRIQSEALLKDGVAASLCWYRVQLTRISAEDDKEIREKGRTAGGSQKAQLDTQMLISRLLIETLTKVFTQSVVYSASFSELGALNNLVVFHLQIFNEM